jgi:hypothetical protein
METILLTALAGSTLKVYDDINDNNIPVPHKPYVNEFLKAINFILITFLGTKNIYILLFFVLFNVAGFVVDNEAYQSPYEYSGLLAACIFTAYMLYHNGAATYNNMTYMDGAVMLASFIIFYIIDLYLCKNIEFSYKKLALRIVGVIILLSFLLLNSYYHFCTEEVFLFLWYAIGYGATSIMFQIYLIMSNDQPKLEETSIEASRSKPTKPDEFIATETSP